MGVLSTVRTEVLQETLSPHHITQPPLGPRIPRERSTGSGPGRLRDGQQERGPGAALGQRCAQRTCSERPSVSMHRGAVGAPSPGREQHSQGPPATPASRQQRTTARAGAVSWDASAWKNHLQSTWGDTTSAKASFRSRERKERAGRESELEPGAESYSPRTGARQQSWRSREGAIHKPPTVSGRAGQAAGPNPGRDGMGAGDHGGEPLGVLMVLSRGISYTLGRVPRFGGGQGQWEMPTAEQGGLGFWPTLCVTKDGWAALPASLPTLPFCPLRPRPRGLCVAGSGWWPLPGGPLQSLQKGSRHLASPEDSGGREQRALGGV